MACGCVVFTSLNHALADHGDTGQTMHQIGCGRLGFDVCRIQEAVADPASWRPQSQDLNALLEGCSEASLRSRWTAALAQMDALHASKGSLLKTCPDWRLRLDPFIPRCRETKRCGEHDLTLLRAARDPPQSRLPA